MPVNMGPRQRLWGRPVRKSAGLRDRDRRGPGAVAATGVVRGMGKRSETSGRVVIVHSLEHARAAVAAAAALGVPVTLLSAPGAAAYAGAGWFLKVVARALGEHPQVRAAAVLDCGGAPGHALGALRQGLRAIRFTGPPATTARIAAIARQYGAVLYKGSGPALDLLTEPDPQAACRKWLARAPALESATRRPGEH